MSISRKINISSPYLDILSWFVWSIPRPILCKFLVYFIRKDDFINKIVHLIKVHFHLKYHQPQVLNTMLTEVVDASFVSYPIHWDDWIFVNISHLLSIILVHHVLPITCKYMFCTISDKHHLLPITTAAVLLGLLSFSGWLSVKKMGANFHRLQSKMQNPKSMEICHLQG